MPLASIVLLLASVLIFEVAENVTRAKIQQRLSDTNDYERGLIKTNIDNILAQALGLAENELMINGLINQGGQQDHLPLFFRSLKLGAGVPVWVTLTDYKGRPLYSNRPLKEVKVEQEKWLTAVIDNKLNWQEVSFDGLLIVVPVIYSGLPEGALHVFVSSADLPQFFLVPSEIGETVIVDYNNLVVATSSENIGIIGNNFSSLDPEVWFSHHSVIGAPKAIKLISALSIKDGLLQLEWVKDFLLITLGISLIILAASTAVSARVAKKQVGHLSKVIDLIHDSSDLKQRVDVSGPREIQALGTKFNNMLEALHLTSASLHYVDSIISNSMDGIITIDAKGMIETFNPASERLFGYAAKEVSGQNVKMLMPEPYQSGHDGYLKRYRDTREAQIIGIGREVTGRRKDGSTFPMELAIGEMDVNGAQMFTGIVRDVTERKQAEKMKSEFISTVSHELRTPLTSIKGSLGLIRSGAIGDLPAKLKSMLDIAYSNSDRLVRLINDILDVEKIEAGKMDLQMVRLDLGNLLEQALEANKGYGEEHGVDFVLSTNVQEAKVEGDPDRLMQVLANLMSNAAKFSPDGSEVAIRLEQREGGFRISVTDHGPGIPEEFKNKIFGKFHQADSSDTRSKGGTGLGLNISQAIVEQHDGTIDFETELGKGSTFFFDLPIIVVSAKAAQGAKEIIDDAVGVIDWLEKPIDQKQLSEGLRLPIASSSNRKARILHVEDDTDILKIVATVVGDLAQITSVMTLSKAKVLLQQQSFDLVILDLILPDGQGEELLPLLKNGEHKSTPVIVFSVNDNTVQKVDGIKAVLVKSKTTNEALLETIRTSIESRTLIKE